MTRWRTRNRRRRGPRFGRKYWKRLVKQARKNVEARERDNWPPTFEEMHEFLIWAGVRAPEPSAHVLHPESWRLIKETAEREGVTVEEVMAGLFGGTE